MTATEFSDWLKDFGDRFPETASWIRGLKDQKQPMLKSWREVLSDCPLSLCLEANRRIARGDDEPVKAYERDQTAAFVRRIARRLSSERSAASERECVSERYRRRDKPATASGKMAKALERVRELVATGINPKAAAAQTFAEMPEAFPADDHLNQRRYRCADCLDSGIVLVWTNKAAELAKAGTLKGHEGQLTAAAFCPCQERGEKQKPVYDKGRLCICPSGNTTSDENRMALVDWLEAWKPANYEPAFDNYNQEAF